MKNPPYKIIAFTGRLQHGKTACAQVLEAHGYKRLRFAEPMKDMLVAMGLTRQQVEVDKEIPLAVLGGKTPRQALQTIGTQWGRDMIDVNLWAHATSTRIRAQLNEGKSVVIDDCRFENEAIMLKAMGAVIVRVERDALMPCPSRWTRVLRFFGLRKEHASEAGFSRSYVDITIKNNGDLKDLDARVHAIMNGEYARVAEVYDAAVELRASAA
jgi:hypothetical protein